MRDFADHADFEASMSHELPSDVASTRIDESHVSEPQPLQAPTRRRRARSEVKVAPVGETASEQLVNEQPEPTAENISTPSFRAEPSDAVPEIVVHHADDIAQHLAERLREVERRELAAAEYETKLQEAEAAARVWVCQRDMELSSLERELQLKSDDVRTQAAAVAAAELAAEQEIRERHGGLRQREAELERAAAQLSEREERLHSEQAALAQAMDKLRAERRREEELYRSRQQKWNAQMEADRAQAERIAANLQKHRLALEERERSVNAREQSVAITGQNLVARETKSSNSVELSALRAQAARDHRLALEHRWIAGQLWTRLASSRLAGDEELQDSLENVREQLDMMYRREREAIENLQSLLAETVRQATPAPRERRIAKPRVLAFTG